MMVAHRLWSAAGAGPLPRLTYALASEPSRLALLGTAFAAVKFVNQMYTAALCRFSLGQVASSLSFGFCFESQQAASLRLLLENLKPR